MKYKRDGANSRTGIRQKDRCVVYEIQEKNPICMVGVYVKFSRTESGISTGKRQSLWVSDLEQMFCKLHSSSADCEDGNDWH